VSDHQRATPCGETFETPAQIEDGHQDFLGLLLAEEIGKKLCQKGRKAKEAGQDSRSGF
jgi:hypothetical protein